MTRVPRFARPLVIGVIAAIALPAAVLAAPPVHSPTVLTPTELAAGDACDFAVVLSNPRVMGHDRAFAPQRDGSQRFASSGFAASRATNVATGASIEQPGGASIDYRFAADGSLVVDARGLNFAWYLPGDDSELGAGLWMIRGHAQEIYDAEGTFVRATFAGSAIDVCAALAD